MGAGAYTFDLIPYNRDGVGVPIIQTVPLPPAKNSGGVKFGDVFLSLSANPALTMHVTIITQNGSVDLGNINVGTGRTGIGRAIQAGDLAAFITFTTTADANAAVALIEYSTP
jgi:hypothetical protein